MNAHTRVTAAIVLGAILTSVTANPLKDHYFSNLFGRQDSVGGCLADDLCSCEGLGALCSLDMSWALDPSLQSVLNNGSTTATSTTSPVTSTPAPTSSSSSTDTPTSSASSTSTDAPASTSSTSPSSTTDAPTSTTSSAQSTNLCVGNQVEGDCVAGTLPSAPPFSGPQGPSCMKADGSPGSAARLNAQKLADAASEYCNNLVNGKVVLSDAGGNPSPGIIAGAAEGGKSMVLVTMYDQTSCPTDKSSSTLDFSAYGVQKCVDAFSTDISQICAQDSTWANFNKDFTVMGGVLGLDCGLFSVYSQ